MPVPELSRKDFLLSALATAIVAAMPLKAASQGAQKPATPELTIDELKAFAKVAGLEFTDEELKEILPDVKDWAAGYAAVRGLHIPETAEPPTVFTPLMGRPSDAKPGFTAAASTVDKLERPQSDEDLAFLSVRELGYLLRARKLTSAELTELYLSRLEKYGDRLLCVVTLLADQARRDAARADSELRAGHDRGPLHGIPCGIKDLFALTGAPTTWGAEPYRTQTLPYDSTVVERLREAGAVIVAKLSMGALAMGDVWFKGKTLNPWNTKEGSSGSSAGSAAATAAGLVGFSIGTETLGSIMSPSTRCRVSGLRPTYGRISRYGAMGLSYTMDKVGPICREIEDCALVLAALAGPDPRDRSASNRPFHYDSKTKLSDLKVAVATGAGTPATNPQAIAANLAKLGIKADTIEVTPPPAGVLSVLEVEAASAFDELTRSEDIQKLTNSAWPQSFRASRFVPGVEYLQAQRARAMLMEDFEKQFGDYDAIAAPDRGGVLLLITNLTGHPQACLPQGTNDNGGSASMSFVGRLYEEDTLVALASAYQRLGSYHRLRPDLSGL